MGTRSLTFVYDGSNSDDENNEPIMCIYRQYDGYPSGHGHELAQFLNSKTLVNGYSGLNSIEANGMGCLAAQLVVQLKHGVGGIYIYAPIVGRDHWQDYEYHVYEDKVIVQNCNTVYDSGHNQVIFDGTWKEFGQFCLDPISVE
jgi:hypothetical protein